MRIGKRLLALNLALLFVIVLLPLQALAAELTLDTPVSYEKTEESEHDTVTFTAPEEGFYRVTVESPEHPGYQVTTRGTSELHMVLERKENDVWLSNRVFYAEAGHTESFQLRKSNFMYVNDEGVWKYSIQKVEPKTLELGVSQKVDTDLYLFTPKQDGRYYVGTETGWSRGGKIIQLPEGSFISSYDSAGVGVNMTAGVQYVITADTEASHTIVVKEIPRSGRFGENGNLTWEVSDGVLKIDGDDTCYYLYNAPWRFIQDEIHVVEIGKNVDMACGLGQLAMLQEIRLDAENEHHVLVDGILYSADKTTLQCAVGPMTELEIPDGVISVSDSAFSACPNLKTLTIPASVERFVGNSFNGAISLTDIYYLGMMSKWNDSGYYYPHWDHIPTVHFVNMQHDDVYYYEPYGDGCAIAGLVGTAPTDVVTLPAAFEGKPVLGVLSRAFERYWNVDILIIPEGVQEIQGRAFSGTGAVFLGLPSSLTSIENYAFENFYNLRDIYFEGTQEQWETLTKDLDEMDTLKRNTIRVHFGEPCPTKLGAEDVLRFTAYENEAHVTGSLREINDDLEIPSVCDGSTVTQILNYYSFANPDVTLTIPASVEKIDAYFENGPGAFVVAEDNPVYSSKDGVLFSKDGKTLLMYPNGRAGNYTVPDGVEAIAPEAFKYNHNLTGLTIPDSVTEFGTVERPSVYKVTTLQYLELGSGVRDLNTVITGSDLRNLERVSVSGNNPEYMLQDGDLVSKDGETMVLHPAMKEDAIVVPAAVNTVGAYAYSNTQAPSALIGSQVTTLAYGAFYGAASLKSLSIPDNVTSLGEGVLHHAWNVEQVALPEGLSRIPDGSFFEIQALKSLYIPASVQEIGTDAMSASWNPSAAAQLTIYFGGTEEQWNDITINIHQWDSTQNQTKLVAVPVGEVLGEATVICNHVHELDEGVVNGNERMRTCTVCGKIVYEEVAEHTHSYTDVVTEPTCTEQGYTTHTCACGDSYKDSYVAALGHDPVLKNAREATCTEAGYTGDKVCQRCNAVLEAGSTIAALGHRWGDWTVTKAATETDEGVETRTCSVCKKTETHSVSKLEPKPADTTPVDPKPTITFTDVPEAEYYAEPVSWAVAQGITNGMGDNRFAPNDTCTRGQIVTFLWRAAGEPKAENTTNPFTDVKQDDYFYDAVLWAVEKGVTKGTSDTTFSPADGCKRSQVVTFLHRAEDLPSVQNPSNPFSDIASGSYYYDAVLWAVEQGITKGTSDTTFSPEATCTRGQIVTFLYRDMA